MSQVSVRRHRSKSVLEFAFSCECPALAALRGLKRARRTPPQAYVPAPACTSGEAGERRPRAVPGPAGATNYSWPCARPHCREHNECSGPRGSRCKRIKAGPGRFAWPHLNRFCPRLSAPPARPRDSCSKAHALCRAVPRHAGLPSSLTASRLRQRAETATSAPSRNRVRPTPPSCGSDGPLAYRSCLQPRVGGRDAASARVHAYRRHALRYRPAGKPRTPAPP